MDENLKQLIDGLNEDLANEYATVILYTYIATAMKGFEQQLLKPVFTEEIPEESEHALYLSEKISTLGGTPTTTPAPVRQQSNAKAMLETALQGEIDTIERYTKRIEQADRVGDFGLKVKLEDMIAEETEHKEKMERLLADPRFH